jgi:hypothetical protein
MIAAKPYNYSDMTGFNNRIVNPALQPLKGYWTVVNDSGVTNQIWDRLTWSNNLPLTGTGMEVYVRGSNNRQTLANEAFVTVSNNVAVGNLIGRYIEVRVGMTRDDTSKQPVLYDLTLHGASSGFAGDYWIDMFWEPFETEDGVFFTDVTGAEPMTYRWYVMPPWTNQWTLVTNATGAELVLTNVDLWDNGTWVSLAVSNAAGQTVWLRPQPMSVWPLPINIPTYGKAARYPATVDVQGEPTNLWHVEVTLTNLTHDYPADLDTLLVSPTGAKIMLMSDAGGATATTSSTLTFLPRWKGYDYPPCQSAIPSGQTTFYSPFNCDGGDNDAMPSPAPAGPYSTELNDLFGANPNGVWELFISDDRYGQGGILFESWRLKFYYQ